MWSSTMPRPGSRRPPRFWGHRPTDVEARLQDELRGGYRIATIGIAGENGVPGDDHQRRPGHGGLGAVIVANRLKAFGCAACDRCQW